jgi:hypothetical protein
MALSRGEVVGVEQEKGRWAVDRGRGRGTLGGVLKNFLEMEK